MRCTSTAIPAGLLGVDISAAGLCIYYHRRSEIEHEEKVPNYRSMLVHRDARVEVDLV
jgi:hypothetical protein